MNKMHRRFLWIFGIILLLAVWAAYCTLTSRGQTAGEQPQHWFQLRLPDGSLVEGYGRSLLVGTSGGVLVTLDGVSFFTHICNIVECSEKP